MVTQLPLNANDKGFWMCPEGHLAHRSIHAQRAAERHGSGGIGCGICAGTRILGKVEAEVIRDYVQQQKLSGTKYQFLYSAGKLPRGFCYKPWEVYRRPWTWFTGEAVEWADAETVRDYIRKRGLSYGDYKVLSAAKKLPDDFPSVPYHAYNKPWSWFTGRVASADKNWATKEEVRAYCRKNRLNQKGWTALGKSGKRPSTFPSDPATFYDRPWSWFTGVKRGQFDRQKSA